jgi:hypothetical protein
MKKFILSLKIVVMVAMIVLMTIVSITNSIDTIIKSIYIFFGFACLGVVPIILENKLYKKTTI